MEPTIEERARAAAVDTSWRAALGTAVLLGIAGVLALIASFLGVGTLLPGEAAIAFAVVGVVLLILELMIGASAAFGTAGVAALLLSLAVAIGQTSTDLSLQRVLIAGGVFVGGTVAIIAIAVFLIARNYMAPTSESGSRLL